MMIFRSIVSAMVIVTVASAAVITLPNYTTTIRLSPYDTEISTILPADATTTAKPATPAPAKVMPTESPKVSCYCNLPECLAAAGGDGTCSTRLGCFTEVQPIIPGIEEEIVTPAVAESNNSVNDSAVSPIIPELVEGEKAPVVATTEHAASIRGSFGCLDLLPFAKQSCDEMLKSMEAEISEFPVIQVPINAARSSANNAGVLAFHCCQTQRCNGNLSGPAEGSVKSAQAVLVAALKTAFVAEVRNFPRWENSTVGGPGKVTSTVKSSINEVELSNAQKTKSTTPDMWHAFFSLGEPKAPSALKSADTTKDASLVDATTPTADPKAMSTTLSAVAVPAIQEMTHNETVGNVDHVVVKRHDIQKAMPIIKQTYDDEENIGDFDDDIAAEVAAVAATAKSPVMPSKPIEQNTPSSWSPRHGGVPDFMPPSTLQKDNNSYSPSRGINNIINNNNDSNNNNYAGSNDSGFNDWIIGIICTITVMFVCVLSVLHTSVLKFFCNIDVLRNYKSNPGQLCSYSGGFIWRRPRTRPSSCDPDTAVNHHACTMPLLPLEELGHANAGASYSDSTGDTTYVFNHHTGAQQRGAINAEPPLESRSAMSSV